MPIFNILQFVNLGNIITEINIIKAPILIIIVTIMKIVVSHRKKSVKFIAEKIVALPNIQIMSNGKKKF